MEPTLTQVFDFCAGEFYCRLRPYLMPTVTAGENAVLRIAGRPGMRVWLKMGAGVSDYPRSTLWGDLYLEPPVLDINDLGVMPENGVLEFTFTVPRSWRAGAEYPLQAVVGSRLTNLMVLKVGPVPSRERAPLTRRRSSRVGWISFQRTGRADTQIV